MRKVILQEFVSLDGLAAGPKGSVDFVPRSTQGDRSFGVRQMAFIDSIDTILLGRTTYQMFAEHWPNVTTGDDKQFADKLNAIPKVVFSTTLKRAPWGSWDPARIAKNPSAEVAQLKQGSGGDMVIWGSISLAQSLIAEQLIDQFQLVVCPIVLGSGTALFRDHTLLDMQLLNTRSFDHGTVLLTYAVEKHSPGSRHDSAEQQGYVIA